MKKIQTFYKKLWKTTEKGLLFLCILLSLFSFVILCSCFVAGLVNESTVVTQGVAILFGVLAALFISFVDYHVIVKWWPVWAATSLLLCFLLVTPLGYTPPGSDDRAWLRMFGLSIQPSELLKLAFVTTFTLHLSKVKTRINSFSHFFFLCLHGGAYTVLVMLQGDYGSATVFFAMFIIMMFSAGLSIRFILVGMVAVLAVIPVVWNYVLPNYLKNRFYVAWNPASDALGRGYQQYRGQIALGSGQWFGRGLFSDELISIPEAHNDFIFGFIGQTLGFLGCMVTILMIVGICWKILWIAHHCDNFVGSSLCVGVFSVIFYQSLINVGMVLCLIPVIGITLPFVSSGGTSLLISYFGIGIVLSVARQNKRNRIFY